MSQEPYRGDLKLTCMTGGGIVARIARGDQPERCREARNKLFFFFYPASWNRDQRV